MCYIFTLYKLLWPRRWAWRVTTGSTAAGELPSPHNWRPVNVEQQSQQSHGKIWENHRKTMEHMGTSTQSGCLNGKIIELNRGWSIAMFDYQRVNDFASFFRFFLSSTIAVWSFRLMVKSYILSGQPSIFSGIISIQFRTGRRPSVPGRVRPQCVFWDDTLQAWSTAGVSLVSESADQAARWGARGWTHGSIP